MTYKTEQIAAMLQLTPRRVRQLATDEQVLSRNPDGTFDPLVVVPQYLEYKAHDATALRKLEAEADLAQAKAREAERQEQIKSRQLYPAKDVRKVWRRALAEIRGRNLEWLRKKMNQFDMKPMDREKEENQFIEFFNELANIDF